MSDTTNNSTNNSQATNANTMLERIKYLTVSELLISNLATPKNADMETDLEKARHYSERFVNLLQVGGDWGTMGALFSGDVTHGGEESQKSTSTGKLFARGLLESTETDLICYTIQLATEEEDRRHFINEKLAKFRRAINFATIVRATVTPVLGAIVGLASGAVIPGLAVGAGLGAVLASTFYLERKGRAAQIETLADNSERKVIESSNRFIRSKLLRSYPAFATRMEKRLSYFGYSLLTLIGAASFIVAPHISLSLQALGMLYGIGGVSILTGLLGLGASRVIKSPEARFYEVSQQTIEQKLVK